MRDIIKCVTEADDDPVFGLGRLVTPIKDGIMFEKFVGKINLNLPMSDFIMDVRVESWKISVLP